MKRLLSACLSVLVFTATAAAQSKPAAPAPQDELARVDASIDALTKKVWPSVVQIQVNSFGARDDAQGQRGDTSAVVGRQRAVGSGFVIDSEGYIITNAH